MNGGRDDSGWSALGRFAARRTLPGVEVTVGLVTGAEGLLVVDTGGSLDQGSRVAGALPRPATHAVVTHGHWDHCFGTPALPGAEVWGQRGLPGALADRAFLIEDAVRYGVAEPAARAAAAALVVPDLLVDEAAELDLGGGCVVRLVHPGPAHTGHDLAVVVPGPPAVVFCGDLVEESGPPQAGHDAVPGRWAAALDRLLAEGGEDAVYVPGHGAPVDAGDVRRQRDALAAEFGAG